jgi:hypothetical protein
MLFHISDQSDIRVFDPRPSQYTAEPVVWAIDDARLRNYLLPRDCPRVTFYAGPSTSAADAARFLGSSRAVVAFESAWLDRVRAARLFCYHLPEMHFTCWDEGAGYFVSRAAVVPQGMDVIEDLLAALGERGVEVRILPSLWSLRDAVIASSLEFSFIRMRNASPRPTPGEPSASARSARVEYDQCGS